MSRPLALILPAALLCAAGAVYAIAPAQFDDPQQAERFRNLTEQMRCLVCQNQNLADSEAFLAGDLRTEIEEMIKAGRSDEEIIQFMTQRYGDFVLYKPPVKPLTWALWFGPAALLLIAVPVAARVRRGRAGESPAGGREAEARKLLGLDDDEG